MNAITANALKRMLLCASLGLLGCGESINGDAIQGTNSNGSTSLQTTWSPNVESQLIDQKLFPTLEGNPGKASTPPEQPPVQPPQPPPERPPEANGPGSCDEPMVVGELPFAVTDTGVDQKKPVVWRFDPPEDGTYTFRTPAVLKATRQVTVYESCTCPKFTMLGKYKTKSETTIKLKKGEPAFVKVAFHYNSNENLTYTLEVSEPCVPECTGKSCGDDGCLGSCGECADSESCSEEMQCVARPPGDVCANAYMVDSLPFEHAGTTIGYGADYFFHQYQWTNCSTSTWLGKVALANDAVYSFTPKESGSYILELTKHWSDKLTLYIATNCDDIDNSCAENFTRVDDEKFVAQLQAGVTYFIFVDATNPIKTVGDYTLKISDTCYPSCSGKECGDNGCSQSCGTCDSGDLCHPEYNLCVGSTMFEGDTCDNPFLVDAVPFEKTVDNAQLSTNNYADISVNGWPDQVFKFTPPSDGVYSIEATVIKASASNNKKRFTVVTDCGDQSLAAASFALGNLDMPMLKGVDYYIIVDTNYFHLYSLTVSDVCTPQCDGKMCGGDGCGASCGSCNDGFACNEEKGLCQATSIGDSCSNPIVVDSLPFDASINSLELHNSYEIDGKLCSTSSPKIGNIHNPDQVFQFSPTTSGWYTFTVTPPELQPVMAGIVSVVTDCSSLSTSCLAQKDVFACGDPNTLAEQLTLMLMAGTDYFIIVDVPSVGTPDTPTIGQLSISTACVPQCDGKQCGDDGCGFQCGTCWPGTTCSDSGTCEILLGDSCMVPTFVDTLPFVVEGKTAGGTNTINATRGLCMGMGATPVSSSFAITDGPDDIYVFTAPQAKTYVFEVQKAWASKLKKNFPAVVVFSDCANPMDACLGLASYANKEKESNVVLPLKSGQTVFVAVDGRLETEYELKIAVYEAPQLKVNEWVPGSYIEITNPNEKALALERYFLEIVGADSGATYAEWPLGNTKRTGASKPGGWVSDQHHLFIGDTTILSTLAHNYLTKVFYLTAEIPTADEALTARIVLFDGKTIIDQMTIQANSLYSLSLCEEGVLGDSFTTPGKGNACCELEE